MNDDNLMPLNEEIDIIGTEQIYNNIIGTGLLLVSYAHSKHFEVSDGSSGSLARHLALDEFYKQLQVDIDKLAETVMCDISLHPVMDFSKLTDNVIVTLQMYLNDLVDLHNKESDPALLSLLENVMVVIKTCIYKYNKLQ